MTTEFRGLHQPEELDMNDPNLAEVWTAWKQTWKYYSRVTDLNTAADEKQVATFVFVLGKAARLIINNFEWDNDGDEDKMDVVMHKFDEYCTRTRKLCRMRYLFYTRNQLAGETFQTYYNALCAAMKRMGYAEFGKKLTDQLLMDRVINGISDSRVRERILRRDDASLEQTLEICYSSEITSTQMKERGESKPEVHAFQPGGKGVQKSQKKPWGPKKGSKSFGATQGGAKREPKAGDCSNCGRNHAAGSCPANGLECHKCHAKGHFAVKCRGTNKGSGDRKPAVRAIKGDDREPGVFSVHATASGDLSADQTATLRLET